MTEITYRVIEHDGGWAYRVGDVFSETFRSHADALAAARSAASMQQVGGAAVPIQFQDSDGKWHNEMSKGGDRPSTDVIDEEPSEQPGS